MRKIRFYIQDHSSRTTTKAIQLTALHDIIADKLKAFVSAASKGITLDYSLNSADNVIVWMKMLLQVIPNKLVNPMLIVHLKSPGKEFQIMHIHIICAPGVPFDITLRNELPTFVYVSSVVMLVVSEIKPSHGRLWQCAGDSRRITITRFVRTCPLHGRFTWKCNLVKNI